MDNNILTIRQLNKTFRMGNCDVEVLKDINLGVKEGDFISVMGPSGSGKSTLLYLMGGLDKVTSGMIEVNGKNLSNIKDKELSGMRRTDIGFVFQFYNLVPNLNVKENIMLPVLLDGKRERDYNKRFEEIIEIVDLQDRVKHTPRELSGGQQQRVAIARALINNPTIILADEPTGNLDSKSGKQVLDLLYRVNKHQKKTIIMVTHSEDSTKYSNRIIRLKDGKIVS